MERAELFAMILQHLELEGLSLARSVVEDEYNSTFGPLDVDGAVARGMRNFAVSQEDGRSVLLSLLGSHQHKTLSSFRGVSASDGEQTIAPQTESSARVQQQMSHRSVSSSNALGPTSGQSPGSFRPAITPAAKRRSRRQSILKTQASSGGLRIDTTHARQKSFAQLPATNITAGLKPVESPTPRGRKGRLRNARRRTSMVARAPSREVSLCIIEARLITQLMVSITQTNMAHKESSDAARVLATLLQVQQHEGSRWFADMTQKELEALLRMLQSHSSAVMLLMRELAKSTKTLEALVDFGGLEVLLTVLGEPSSAAVTNHEETSSTSVAAGVVVARLCSFPPEVQLQVACHSGALSALLQLAHSQHEVDQQEAVAALLFLSQNPSSREALVLHGGAELVTPLAGRDFQSVQALSAIALAELSKDPKSHGPLTTAGGVRMSLNLVSNPNLDCARHATLALRQMASGSEHRGQVLEGVAKYAASCTAVEYVGASRLITELMEDAANRGVLLDLGLISSVMKMGRKKNNEVPEILESCLTALALACIEPQGQLTVSRTDNAQSLLVDISLQGSGIQRRMANLALCRMASHPAVELTAARNWNSQSVKDKFKSIFLPDEPAIVDLPPAGIGELDEVIASAWEAEPRTAALTCYQIGVLAQDPKNHQMLEERNVLHLIAAMAYSTHEEVQLHAAIALKVLVEAPSFAKTALELAVPQMKALSLSKDAEVQECMQLSFARMKVYDTASMLNDDCDEKTVE